MAAPAPEQLDLLPGRAHEHCQVLEVGQGIAYRFAADAPLAFNIHRHEGETVIYPVQIPRAKALDAVFEADTRAEWCWMWVNRSEASVRLTLRLGT